MKVALLRRHFRQGGKTTIHGWTSLGIKLRNLDAGRLGILNYTIK